jgi:hypothetical protein
VQEVSAGITAQDAQPSSGTRFGAVGLHWLNGLLQLRPGNETSAQSSFQRELIAGDAGHLYAAECCANVHYAMGAAQWARGNTAAAIAELDRALALAPGQPMARAARAALASEGERDALRAQLALRLDRLRSQRLTIDAAMAEGVDAVIRGDVPGAVAAGQQGCLDAPPGSQGWSLPIDPLLRVYTNEAAWTGPTGTAAHQGRITEAPRTVGGPARTKSQSPRAQGNGESRRRLLRVAGRPAAVLHRSEDRTTLSALTIILALRIARSPDPCARSAARHGRHPRLPEGRRFGPEANAPAVMSSLSCCACALRAIHYGRRRPPRATLLAKR